MPPSAVFALAAPPAAPPPLAPPGETRRRVFGFVQRHPGLHQAEIARALALGETTAEAHLHRLVEAGLLARQKEGGFVRYYAAVQGITAPEGAVAPADRPLLAVLRQARPLRIVAVLLQRGELPMAALAEAVGLSPSAATYQVDKLERAGLAERVAAGPERHVRLRDRDRTVALLLEHEPPRDLVAGFESLWRGLGF